MALIRLFAWVCLLIILWAEPVYSIPRYVKVRLFEARAGVPRLQLTGGIKIIEPVSRDIAFTGAVYTVEAEGGRVALYAVRKGGRSRTLILRGSRIVMEESGSRGMRIVFSGRSACNYRGIIVVRSATAAGRPSLDVLNEVPVREFVYGIVASELPRDFAVESKKALAVLTLTRLEFLPDQRAIGDSTKSELYTGCGRVRESDRVLVDSVFKERLYYKGRLVLPYYHSTCAGCTSDGDDLFRPDGDDLSYLKAVKCEHCKGSPFYRNKVSVVDRRKVTEIFGGALPVVLAQDGAGRPKSIQVGKQDLSCYQTWLKLGRGLGWSRVPGTRFAIKSTKDKIEIVSSGAGHGVGLCQWGANGLAGLGKSYREILEYYFPGSKIK
ncbi:SpoIID/LytB domain-containing protein [bacterium]|nr:SpoIID/LytB domain-containing protein [bacterium]